MGLFRRNKNNNKPVIRQILDLVPRWLFESCTNTYKTDKGVSKYKTYDQFSVSLFSFPIKSVALLTMFLRPLIAHNVFRVSSGGVSPCLSPVNKVKDNKNCQNTTATRMFYDPMLCIFDFLFSKLRFNFIL